MQKNDLIDIIYEKLYHEEEIMGFIKNEVYDSLYYLNRYKLENLYLNIDQLINNLKELSNNYKKEFKI